MNFEMSQTKFAIGDEVICNCGNPFCEKYFRIVAVDEYTVVAKSVKSNNHASFGNSELQQLELSPISRSPLFQALK